MDDGVDSFFRERLAEFEATRLPETELVELAAGFQVPASLYDKLFEFQQTALAWFWELHSQEVGGILGDEMGLGKTIQVAAFLGAMQYQGLLQKPCLVVCPATVMKHWVQELHKWWPPLRVVVCHATGSAAGLGGRKMIGLLRAAPHGGVLIVSYGGLHAYAQELAS